HRLNSIAVGDEFAVYANSKRLCERRGGARDDLVFARKLQPEGSDVIAKIRHGFERGNPGQLEHINDCSGGTEGRNEGVLSKNGGRRPPLQAAWDGAGKHRELAGWKPALQHG